MIVKGVFGATVLVGVLGAAPALAGEGAAAGSAAFTIDGGAVNSVAVSAAVGKQDAFAGAYSEPNPVDLFNAGASIDASNTAFALGSAGEIAVTDILPGSVTTLDGSADPDLSTAQANELAANSTIFIGTDAGDPVVELVPTP